jgi:hypothetical protein
LHATGSFYDANIDEKRVRPRNESKGRDNKADGVERSNTKKERRLLTGALFIKVKVQIMAARNAG